MNFQTVLEELERLYDEETVSEKPEEAKEEKVVTEAAEPDNDDVDDEEIVIEDDEPAEEKGTEETITFVLECCNCGAVSVKVDAEAKVDEESGLVNTDEACQYCEATEGYKILGTLNPYAAADTAEVEADVSVEEEEIEEAEEEAEEKTEG